MNLIAAKISSFMSIFTVPDTGKETELQKDHAGKDADDPARQTLHPDDHRKSAYQRGEVHPGGRESGVQRDDKQGDDKSESLRLRLRHTEGRPGQDLWQDVPCLKRAKRDGRQRLRSLRRQRLQRSPGRLPPLRIHRREGDYVLRGAAGEDERERDCYEEII